MTYWTAYLKKFKKKKKHRNKDNIKWDEVLDVVKI